MSKRPSKELQEEWRQKLKESGFEDLEDEGGYIDRGSWDFRTPKVIGSYKIKLDYYYRATQFLNDYMFDSDTDKIIWTYHADGIGERKIVVLLKQLGHGIWARATVGYAIRRLNREMKEFYANRGLE